MSEFEIDHLMIGTPELDTALRTLQRLGFRTSQRGRHERLGTANHVVPFADGTYLEVIAVTEPRPENATYRTGIEATGGGVTGLALRTEDARVFFGVAEARGLCPERPLNFGRWVEEVQARARFSIVRLSADCLPPLSVFACQHLTPESVWLYGQMKHPNAVVGLDSLTILDDQGTITRIRCRRSSGGLSSGEEGSADAAQSLDSLLIANQSHRQSGPTAPRFKVEQVGLTVSDLEKTRRWLEAQGLRPAAPASSEDLRLTSGLGPVFAFVEA